MLFRSLAAALEDMAEQLGDRPACVVRELTKLHEEMRRGSLVELAGHYQQAGAPKGEIVIVVGPPLKAAPLSEDEIEALILARLENKSVRDAAQEIALETGLPKRQIYARALDISKGQKKGQAS